MRTQENLNITLIQTTIDWENKNANLLHFEKLILSVEITSDIIVLPEMFTTGFSMQPHLFAEKMNGQTIAWMQKIAAEKKVAITGSIIINEDEKFYNRLIWCNPDGAIFYYDKKHLFSLSNEPKYYSAGKEKIMIVYKGWNICPLICYDLRFPVWCRNNAETPYDLLLFVANWPQKRIAAWQTLLKARAIENQSYVVGINRIGNDGNQIYHNGSSSIFDAFGETIFQIEDVECVKTFALNKNELITTREKLPFLNDIDHYTVN